LLNGPYGPYLQLGLPEEDAKKKPKRISIPKDIPLADVNLEIAMQLIALPRDLGLHPETNKKIVANIGRFGPYVNHDGKFKSIPRTDSVFTINLDRAVELTCAGQFWSSAYSCFRRTPKRRRRNCDLFRPLWALCSARKNSSNHP